VLYRPLTEAAVEHLGPGFLIAPSSTAATCCALCALSTSEPQVSWGRLPRSDGPNPLRGVTSRAASTRPHEHPLAVAYAIDEVKIVAGTDKAVRAGAR
jgi:hypothetical protein